MADQEFLASFGVDIDEGGVARLQQILSENRTLAQSLADSFSAASESIRAFKEEVYTDLPSLFSGTGYGNVTESLFGSAGGLTVGLDMTEPRKEISSFTADAKKPIALSANASGIVSAARTALESVRSLFSETFTINVRASTSSDGSSDDNSSRTDSRNRDDTGTTTLKMSAGGRFTRPTDVQVAEDGDAEYIIPVKKEGRALPLLCRLLSELSPEARQSLTGTDSVISEEAEYNFALNIDADTSQGGDIINEARRLPDQIRLSVVETDVEAQPGRAASMLSALDSIRRNRVLCRLTTDMGSWDKMFISEITATQDEANQYGWAGDIVFMQYIPKSEQYYSGSSSGTAVSSTSSTRKTSNNSSIKKNIGTKAAAATVSSAAASAVSGALATVLSRAGITGGTLYKS